MSSRFRDATIPDAPARQALLLANHGTPQAPTAGAVRRYLGEFLHDYRVVEMSRWLWCPLLHFAILPLRAPKVARAYASIWTPQGSPLLAHSRALATALQAQLPDFDVRLGMRYGEPSIASALRELQSRGAEKLLVLPLYPQYSASTSAAVFDAVANELGRWRRVPELRLVGDYHDDEGWLDALTASVQSHWDLHGRGEKLLLSFHGLPQRFVTAGDPYARQCEAGAQKLAARLGLAADQWQLAYQSRFGREAWLAPYTDHVLRDWGAKGIKRIDVLCPGFAADCLETLEEIAMQNARLFGEFGGELRYIPALNASAAHVSALAALARRHTQGWAP